VRAYHIVVPHWQVPNGGVTECSAAEKSLEFRSQEDHFVSLSFGTISSSGATGSIIHYRYNVRLISRCILNHIEKLVVVFVADSSRPPLVYASPLPLAAGKVG